MFSGESIELVDCLLTGSYCKVLACQFHSDKKDFEIIYFTSIFVFGTVLRGDTFVFDVMVLKKIET